MSHFLCKSVLFGSFAVRNSSPIRENPNVFPLRWVSIYAQQSFTVSYLKKALGFSQKSALSASKYVNFDSPRKADDVINLFKNYHFTQTQVASIVRIQPKILTFDADKTILPKLEFLKSKGISGPKVAKTLSVFPTLFERSLSKQIMASYGFFRALFQSDEIVTAAVERYPGILSLDIDKYISPKIDILRQHGVPNSSIARLVLYWPKSFVLLKPDKLGDIVEKVEDMGFRSSRVKFVLAAHAFLSMSKSTWESKVDAFKKWGLSEKEVLKAFQRNPWSMMLSEDKIVAGMDFFINQMGSTHCLIAKSPQLLLLSLKKRLIPSSSVFQVLLSKGLVKEKISLVQLFIVPDKKFLQQFVMPYKVEAPELLKLYEEKLNLSNGPFVDEV